MCLSGLYRKQKHEIAAAGAEQRPGQ